MKKILALLLVVILTATVSISGTLAFVQASAAPVDVMEAGDVSIDQHIYYRVFTTGDGTQSCTIDERKPVKDENNVSTHGSLFLYPAVYSGAQPSSDTYSDSSYTDTVIGGQTLYSAPNILDEIAVIQNTGNDPAYVRTWIAVECGSMDKTEFEKYVTLKRNNGENADWTWSEGKVEIYNGKSYYVLLATYNNVLGSQAKTSPSLLQVMLNKEAGNEQCAALDSNNDYTMEIRIFSQATHTSLGSTAQAALDTAFQTNAPWAS